MSREEAVELVKKREGRLCVRFYRRADGTVLTRDCPEAARTARRRVLLLLGTGTAAMVTFCSWAIMALHDRRATLCAPGGPGILRKSVLRDMEPFASVLN